MWNTCYPDSFTGCVGDAASLVTKPFRTITGIRSCYMIVQLLLQGLLLCNWVCFGFLLLFLQTGCQNREYRFAEVFCFIYFTFLTLFFDTNSFSNPSQKSNGAFLFFEIFTSFGVKMFMFFCEINRALSILNR